MSQPKISFIYATCRKEPHLEWFVDSLYTQAKQCRFPLENIQLVIVDFHLQYDAAPSSVRRTKIEKIINNRFDFVHVEPSPSPYQGKYRLTKKDYFCASIPRNTGILHVKHPYVVIVDDLSVMLPNSLTHIIDYARQELVVAFGYKKVFDLKVEEKSGSITSVRETDSGTDCRWNQDGGSLFRQIGGGQFYGYGCYPLSVFLKVNGYDEICNANGGEDYHFGIRVQKTGEKIYYSKSVAFYESEDFSSEADVSFAKRDPLFTLQEYSDLMQKYGVSTRFHQDGRLNMSYFILDLLTRDKYWTEGNNYNLSQLRQSGMKTLPSQSTTLSFDGLELSTL